MNKKISILFIIISIIIVLTFVSCSKEKEPVTEEPSLLEFTNLEFSGQEFSYDGQTHSIQVDNVPEGATVSYDKNEISIPGAHKITATIRKEGYKDKTLEATMTIKNPTSSQVVNARKDANNQTKIGYDFTLNLGGTLSIYGFSQTANAHYEGQYRFDKTTNSMNFKRETSGLLLYDSIEYIKNENGNKIKLKVNPDTKALNSISIMTEEEAQLNLINLPFTELVDNLETTDILNIRYDSSNPDYKFVANLNLSADNPILNKILNVIGKLGTSVSINDVSFTNPVSGIVLYFNLDSSMKLEDFKFSVEVSFPISSVETTLTLDYEQKANTSEIEIPSYSDFQIDKNQINTTLSSINSSIEDISNDDTYSLDVLATNQFDPGWNVSATVDKYFARMYKNTYTLDDATFTAFNHSYRYKTHHEEDGKETYDYTIGNVYSDNSTWLISRKGTNTQTEIPEKTIDTQFNYLINPFKMDANNIDCIKIVTKNNRTTYQLFLNSTATLSAQNKILDFINSNDAEGVIKVNNYVSSQVNVVDAYIEVTIVDSKLSKIEMNTKIKYTPTDGDYTESNVTLSDSLVLSVNENYSTALEYKAPKNATTSGITFGLNNSKYFIL